KSLDRASRIPCHKYRTLLYVLLAEMSHHKTTFDAARLPEPLIRYDLEAINDCCMVRRHQQLRCEAKLRETIIDLTEVLIVGNVGYKVINVNNSLFTDQLYLVALRFETFFPGRGNMHESRSPVIHKTQVLKLFYELRGSL